MCPAGLIVAASAAIAASAAAQTTLYVNGGCGDDAWSGLSEVCQAPDGPKATIQAAIDASVSGDEVVVADGVYTGDGNRDLDFDGRLIVVRSASGPGACEIDCGGRAAGLHRGFIFQSGETAEAAVQGFTIRNGYADNGGAILCLQSNPTIRECRFLFNTAEPQDVIYMHGFGGALYCVDDDTLTVEDCYFEGNVGHYDPSDISGGGGAIGAGHPDLAFGDLLVERCTFVSNESTGYGGGICALKYDVTVRDSTFEDNTSEGPAGAFVAGFGGFSLFERCTFSRNIAEGVQRLGDGGAVVYDLGAAGMLIDCRFIDNEAAFHGGAIYLLRSTRTTAIDCEFTGNAALFGGGVALGLTSTSVSLVNCTLSGNAATYAGALWVAEYGRANVSNSILWGDAPDEIYGVGIATVTYSDVQGGWDGPGNIDVDPLFADPAAGDFRPLAYSPCIDAADNTALPPEILTDLDGRPRFRDDPWTADSGIPGGSGGQLIVDMGAYEFQGASCAADFNADGAANTLDVLAFLNAWTAQDSRADFNGDGAIDTRDVLAFLNAWTAGC